MTLPPISELTPEFWEQRYQEGRTGWDLGQGAPPFVHLLNSATAPKPGRMAVLGAGRGHDALLFAKYGFEVIGFDVAPSAIAVATESAQAQAASAQFLQRDIFSLAQEFAGEFDYVLEHTCFCAIAPDLRPAYVKLVRKLLRPQGEFIALFWAHDMPGGPPFGSTPEELQQLFAADFDIISFTPAVNSVESRSNEYLARFQPKSRE